jgi:S-adenosylmethionine/arginine decarboxylase-like enzyme
METKLHPTKSKLHTIKELIKGIVSDLHMDILGGPYVYYQGTPYPHKGITGICSIQTSHISFHFWDTPSHQTLNNVNSRSLLQFDVYTCGSLTLAKAMNVIRRLQVYQPTEIDVDIINRKNHLKIDHTLRWNDHMKQSFEAFLDTY